MLAQTTTDGSSAVLPLMLIPIVLFLIAVVMLRWILGINWIIHWLKENNKELKQIRTLLANGPKVDRQGPVNPLNEPIVVAKNMELAERVQSIPENTSNTTVTIILLVVLIGMVIVITLAMIGYIGT